MFTSLTKTLCFLDSQNNIELETSRHEFADRIHQNKQELTAKSEAKAKREGNRRRFKNMWHRVRRKPIYCDLHAQILIVSLPQFSRLFCLLSSKILQNSLLDLYLVDIRRYKLSLFQRFQPSRFDRESPDLMSCLPLSRFLPNSPDLL